MRVQIVTIFLDSVYWSGMPKNEFLKKCSKVLHMLGNDSWWLLLASGDILRPFGTIWEQLVFWHKNTFTLMARNPPCPEVCFGVASNFRWKRGTAWKIFFVSRFLCTCFEAWWDCYTDVLQIRFCRVSLQFDFRASFLNLKSELDFYLHHQRNRKGKNCVFRLFCHAWASRPKWSFQVVKLRHPHANSCEKDTARKGRQN